MELLSKAVPITMLAFVVSSMLAVGLSLTIRADCGSSAQWKTCFSRIARQFCADATGGISHSQNSEA